VTKTPDPIDLRIGSRIRAHRRSLGLSQSVLAAAAGLGFQELQKYERGLDRVAAPALLKIADGLDTTVACLVGDVEPEIAVPEFVADEFPELCAPGASELLEAFIKIADPNVRKAVVRLIRAMAKADVDEEPDWTQLAMRALGPSRSSEV
jgi:transcriptional regulator with XRE-family HTH domain